jgi:hypothetical protein
LTLHLEHGVEEQLTNIDKPIFLAEPTHSRALRKIKRRMGHGETYNEQKL